MPTSDRKFFSIIGRKLARGLYVLTTQGPRALWRGMQHNLFEYRQWRNYRKWIRAEELLRTGFDATDRKRAANLNGPLISVLLPVYNIDEKWLRKCIDSVLAQIYPRWELCIADDHSTYPRVRTTLEEYAGKDERIKVVYRSENGHISAASNSALQLATGKFCVLLDHDDEMSSDALYWVAREICEFPETKMIYSDEDMIDRKGGRYYPKFKPDFSRDLLYSENLVTHLSAYDTELLRGIGGFRVGFEGSQDYDLALRVIEKISEDQIRHIPRILYHWRAIEGSVALGGEEKPYAHERARTAIREHFERMGAAAEVEATVFNLHRVRYKLPSPSPKVDVLVFGEGASDCLANLRRLTAYDGAEFHRICPTARSGLAEALNSAAYGHFGELICFVEAGFAPVDPDWLGELARFAYQQGIGAIGAKLLDKDDLVIGGGLIIGVGGTADVAHARMSRKNAGHIGRNLLIGNYLAVTVGCMMTRREVFESVGGFDADAFPRMVFDADYCLRLREKLGLRIVVTPYAELRSTVRHAGGRRPVDAELRGFRLRWPSYINRDPFYNPNLSKLDGRFLIDRPIAIGPADIKER